MIIDMSYVSTSFSSITVQLRYERHCSVCSVMDSCLSTSGVWNDSIDYCFTIGGYDFPLARRKCGFPWCRKTTQLELCTKHLQTVGLEVKESEIHGAGWGLFTTSDRGSDEVVAYFTGVEVERATFVGSSEYHSNKGGGISIDSSIERCSAACANSLLSEKNSTIITFGKQCYIKTIKPIRGGDEIYVAYGTSYRWKRKQTKSKK